MANKNLKIKQYCRIVKRFSEEENISLDDALSIFYNSIQYKLLDEEIGEYHCQGDLYIVRELQDTYHKLRKND